MSSATPVRTLAELFARRVADSPAAAAYREWRGEPGTGGHWQTISWADAGQAVAQVGRALGALGLEAGARVGLLLPNGFDAVRVDQALLARGLVPVPMHALDNPGSIAFILADCEAALLVAATDTQFQAILGTGQALPALRQVVVVRREHEALPGAVPGAIPVATLQEWLAAPAPDSPGHTGPAADDLAAIVYTSGTTGRPKGVMLTHANVLANVQAVRQRFDPGPRDVFLSFLPLSHTFERTVGYTLPIACGSCVAFSRSIAQLPEDLLDVRPTLLVSVPRIFEKVFAQVEAGVAGSSWRRGLLHVAVAAGWRNFQRVQKLAPSGGLGAAVDRLAVHLLDPFVGRRVRARFGGRLRLAVSGGAALAPAVARLFIGLGLPLVQGYGMTETSPVVSANSPDDNDPSSVGRVVPGTEVRLGERAELQVRGPGVMRGYWKRPEDTAQAFIDGWLRTGDQAAIEGGRIRILGRIKEIIVTAGGEKIAPADVEQAILGDSLFEQAWVFGEARPFIACMVVLARPGWQALAAALGLDPREPASLEAAAALQAVLQRIEQRTGELPRHARPRKVLLELEAWTTENGLLTPTLKLKRRHLEARFGPRVERLYAR